MNTSSDLQVRFNGKEGLRDFVIGIEIMSAIKEGFVPKCLGKAATGTQAPQF